MCSIATRQLIDNSVQDFITLRKPFTAYDVTKDIRTKGASERHNELKREVHQLFDNGQMSDYQRTLVRLPGAPTPAFMYHPPEIDANAHVAGTATPQTVVQTAPATAPQAQQVVTTAPSFGGLSISKQGNGFIRIPVSLTRDIGLKPGDDAAVYVDGNSVKVSPVGAAPISAGVQKVDPRGNVRVYGTTLSDANLYSMTVSASISNGVIEVTN